MLRILRKEFSEMLIQKEFNARKHNQRQRIVKGEAAAVAQSNKAAQQAAKYEDYAATIKKEFGGDIEKWLEANPRAKGKYAQGPHREALEGMLKGGNAADQAKIQKATRSAQIQADRAADQVHNYGKTRQSVRTEAGNTFTAGGKNVNVREGALGDAAINTKSAKLNGGNQTSSVLSATSEQRAKDVQRLENRGFDVGPNTKKSTRLHKKSKTHIVKQEQATPIIDRKGVENAATAIEHTTPNRTINLEAKQTPKGTTESIMKIKDNKNPKIKERIITNKKDGLLAWMKQHPGKTAAIIGGTAAVAGGTTYVVHKHNKNKNKE